MRMMASIHSVSHIRVDTGVCGYMAMRSRSKVVFVA
jgi:hypothetical protein